MPGSHLSGIPIADVVATGGFSVNPGKMFTALGVPRERLFVLTDVIVFPEANKNNSNFKLLYRIEEHAPGTTTPGTGVKFQYKTIGTGQNWSQHFTGGIKFVGGKNVVVACGSDNKAPAFFQLLGYFTNP
jgi:hypothetical protein